MTSEDREVLLATCGAVREMLNRQIAANRSLHALFLAPKTQLPGLEAAYPKARMDALFATEESVTITNWLQRIDGIIERLKLD